MIGSKTITKQINKITSQLIEVGLSDDQNYPSSKNGEVYISKNHDLSISLKNIPYDELYKILDKNKNYNIKMLDGALIQMMYSFDTKDVLTKHRLAFYPSPNLEEFQNNSEIYALDDIYADIIGRHVVAVPIRFDYDSSIFEPRDHPKVHLTLGQYKNCRIPVKMPMTPYVFIDFILRSFYNTAKRKFSDKLNLDLDTLFENTLDPSEKKVLHLAIDV